MPPVDIKKLMKQQKTSCVTGEGAASKETKNSYAVISLIMKKIGWRICG
jgi:hypothetical protein